MPPLLRASILCLCLSGVPSMVSAAEDPQPFTAIDRILVVVGDDIITQTELDHQIKNISRQLRAQKMMVPAQEVLEKQVMERMILEKIQLQLAKETGIMVDEDTLNRTISAIAAQNNLSLSQFRDVLERDGISFPQFREDMRREITTRRLRQRQVDNRISVSDQEIDSFIEEQARRGASGDEYHLGHILVALPDAATPEQIEKARQRAQQIHDDLLAGVDFGQMAISYSDGQQALNGGDLGWRKVAELPTLFTDVVTTLQVSGISDLIRSPSGFHIIKLIDHRRGEQHIVEQTLARHILIRPDEITSSDTALATLLDLKTRLRAGEDFADLARQYSDDSANAKEGGALGWVNPGEMVPEFEQEMARLAKGEISDPVQTPFGWHLIQVLDRRQSDLTEEFTRSKVREQLYQRKAEEEYENWLRRLRDEAYVEFRDQ